MVADNKDVILSEYREKHRIYEEFTLACEDLTRRLLRCAKLRVHSVTSRTKEIEKLAKKISRPGKQYDKLEDVTDLSGVRVITYFPDDVDRIGTLIEQEFNVFPDKSIDKRVVLDPDRFGYLSLHYVCTLSDDRLALSEYSTFRGHVCEIQIRTILQHAWAEIEHDLGYKVPQGIPKPTRRRFSRLASLLEMGDDEFKNIRDELETYAVNVKRDIPSDPSKVLVDRISLMAFIEQDTDIRKLDQTMADHLHAKLIDVTNGYADIRVEELQYVGIQTIGQLKSALKQKADVALRVFKGRAKGRKGASFTRGIGVFYLVQVLIAEQGNLEATAKALVDLHLSLSHGIHAPSTTNLAKKIIELVHKKE